MLIRISDKKEVLFFEAVYFKKIGKTIFIKIENGAEKKEINVEGKKLFVNNVELK